MNGKIEEDTLERMEEIRGKGPIRRGLDKAINECLDVLEDKVVTTDEEGRITDVKELNCLNSNAKRCLE